MTYKELYSDYKWIKVKRYKMDESKSWEDRYKDLDEHHLKETTFLIGELRSLADKLDQLIEQKEIAKKDEKLAELYKTFFLFWGGFSLLGALTMDYLIDKQVQSQYNWILGGILLFGLICSSVLTYIKWRCDHD